MKNIAVYQRVILFLIILFIIGAIPSVTWAKAVGVISRIEGKADILKEGEMTPVPVNRGDAISTGDILRTKPDSMAEVTFKDDTSVILAPETRIKIDDYNVNPDNSREKGTISLLRGKMRAVVSKTKEGAVPLSGGASTFDVHSPTAIAGNRGASMLVWYTAGVTGVIVKDGSGFAYNPNDCAPSQSVNVNDGQMTLISGQCSPPLPVRQVTDAELMQHTRETTMAKASRPGGEEKGQYEVYGDLVPPTGDLFGYKGPADHVSEFGDRANRDRDDSRGKKSRHDQEFSEKHPDKLKGKKDEDKETPLAFSDKLSGSYFFYNSLDEVTNDSYSSMEGIIGATQSPFAVPTVPVPIDLKGKTVPDGYISWWNNIEGNDVVNTKSHWYGTMAGLTTSENTVKGMMNALYIDEAGKAGILKGQFTGTYNPETDNKWSADGTLMAAQKSQGYDPARFSDYLDYSGPDGDMYGQFAGNTGDISSDDSLVSIDSDEIDSGTKWFSDPDTGNDEPWGVYAVELGGNYSNPGHATAFSLDAGGNEWKDWSDYWIAHISGQWNTDKTIGGSVNGRYLTPYALGSISGGILGSYDTDTHGTWEGMVLGEFTETPLAFSGLIDIAGTWDSGPYYGLYGGGLCDCFDALNDVYGRAGGVLSPWIWDGSQWSLRTVPVVYMGESGAGSDDHLNPLVWNDDFFSYNEESGEYTTFDNGAFYGFIGGVWKDKAIDGRVVSLYMDPAGNAGYLTGDVAGVFYPEFYKNYNIIFEADGTWTPTQMATASDIEMAPSDFYASGVSTDSTMTATVAGAFDGSNGSVSGGEYLGWTRYIDGQRWGVFDLLVTGYESDGLGYSNPDNDASWSARIGGDANFGSYHDGTAYNGDYGYYLADIADGSWDGGRVSGVLDGRFISYTKMGSMNGDLLGYYDGSHGSNDWAATSPGTWSGTPLAFSGDFGDYYHYYDKSTGWLDDNIYSSPISGVFGSVVSPFQTPDTPVMLYLIGEGYPVFDATINPSLWWATIYGNNYVDTSSAWDGWLGGYTSIDGNFTGMMNGLYTDADGNSGILLSSYFTGNYYPGLNMWEAEGGMTAIEMVAGYTPGLVDYNSGYPETDVYDTLHGGFGGSDGDIRSYAGSLQGQNEMGYVISETRHSADAPWGIYQLAFGGEFTNKPAGASAYTMAIDEGNNWVSVSDTWGNYTTGTWGVNNTIEGKTYGYIADTSTPLPTTWISAGDTLGTFDPDSATWQVVQMGVFLETNQFLSMLQSVEGQAKLAQLNIPYAEVGRATLSGSGNNFTSLSMTDTIFFAYNSGEAPKIWTTGNVSGSYTADPALSVPVPLSGGVLTADFTPRAWDTVNGQWRSDISGSGGYNGSTSFKGAGAGAINTGNATISGTAAGIAK